MKLCSMIVRVLFLSFFVLNAWNLLSKSGATAKSFEDGIEECLELLNKKWALDLNKYINVNFFLENSFDIVKYSFWAQLSFAIAGIFICPGFAMISVLIYLKMNFMCNKILKISSNSSLLELEDILKNLTLLVATFYLAACSKRKKGCTLSAAHCPKKN